MFSTSLLAGKKILITGGGSGLGAELASRFSSLGAELVLVGRRIEPLQMTANAIRDRAPNSCPKIQTFSLDIRNAQAVEEQINQICEGGIPNVLVNNAAASFIAQTETLSAKAVDAVLNTTLHGALYCTLAMGKRWIATETPGVILSMLSTSTITGRAYTVPSAMAKSGLLAMTRSLAVEWGPNNIRCVAIAPGPFPTSATSRQLNPSLRENGGGRSLLNPLGRVGDPSELANLASYLVSDAASFINGEMVVIDGGAHLRTSGAEDLLGWTSERWEELRAQRI